MTQIDVLDAGERTLDTVVGGGAGVFDAARRPRTSARRAQRRGARANDAIADRAERAIDLTIALPERLLTQYLRGVRGRARRQDVVGLAARTLLSAVNTPASSAAGFFGRLERETALPRRAPRSTVATEARAAGRRTASRARRATTTPRVRGGRATTTGRGRRTQQRRSA